MLTASGHGDELDEQFIRRLRRGVRQPGGHQPLRGTGRQATPAPTHPHITEWCQTTDTTAPMPDAIKARLIALGWTPPTP